MLLLVVSTEYEYREKKSYDDFTFGRWFHIVCLQSAIRRCYYHQIITIIIWERNFQLVIGLVNAFKVNACDAILTSVICCLSYWYIFHCNFFFCVNLYPTFKYISLDMHQIEFKIERFITTLAVHFLQFFSVRMYDCNCTRCVFVFSILKPNFSHISA